MVVRYAPVETIYAGCRFRSRLEARWAVVFDVLGIEWQYEPERFQWVETTTEGSALRSYLPDFYLPGTRTWVEVKGDETEFDRLDLETLVDYGGVLPHVAESYCPHPDYRPTTRGLLLLGPIPRPGHLVYHPLVQHWKGLFTSRATLLPISLASTVALLVNDDGDAGEYDLRTRDVGYSGHSWWFAEARSARFERDDAYRRVPR